MLSIIYRWICYCIWMLWCCFLDYSVYVLVDYIARRRLKFARNDDERNSIWQILCLSLTIVSLPIYYFHHYPGFLWFMIALTFLLTIRRNIIENYNWAKLNIVRTCEYPVNILNRARNYIKFSSRSSSTNDSLQPVQSLMTSRQLLNIGPSPLVNMATKPKSGLENGILSNIFNTREKFDRPTEVDELTTISGHYYRRSVSPNDRLLRKPLRPTSFESSGYGSPLVASTPYVDVSPDAQRNVSETGRFATSTPVDPWLSRRTFNSRYGY